MRILLTCLLTVLLPVITHAADPVPSPIRIVLIGDSTVCNYPVNQPTRGWGQYLPEYFTPGTVTITNLAAAGRSTKTFITEGRWQKALDLKPDYILIQFGHNDSHSPDQPEATDPATTYPDYLRRYIDDARAHGATPILITPMVRRTLRPPRQNHRSPTPGPPADRLCRRHANRRLGKTRSPHRPANRQPPAHGKTRPPRKRQVRQQNRRQHPLQRSRRPRHGHPDHERIPHRRSPAQTLFKTHPITTYIF